MLELQLDLIPFGIEEKRETIGYMTIVNDGTGTRDVGNYDVVLSTDCHTEQIKIKNFKRKRGAWALVKKILQSKDERN